MRQYILRRVLLIIPTLIGVTIIVSLLAELLPGDFIDVMLVDHIGQGESRDELRAKWEAELGWNDPWVVQYGNWLWRAVQGDLGTSLIGSFNTVVEEIQTRIPVTLELGLLALLVGVVIAMPVGIISAVRQDSASTTCFAAPRSWRSRFPDSGSPC